MARRVGMVTHRAELSEELARLTRRQQDIACLIEGLSNAEMAERLVLVEGTVANHVETILRHLEFRSRIQIGVWAVERSLHRSGWDD